MADTILELRNLTVEFPTRRGPVQAVRGISLSLLRGERIGLVGESGSGKSMTLLTAMRLTPPPGRITRGRIIFKGQDLLSLPPGRMRALRGREMAMIFQDPMTTLNPVHRVGEQIRESLKVHNICDGGGRAGRLRAERERVLQVMAEVGIPSAEERYEAYPHEFSGGMQQRAVIAIALSCNPDLLLADEPTTSLDVTVQAQIMALLERINQERGTAVILVTHDLSLAAEFCRRIAVMYAGSIVEIGGVDEVIDSPRHPYTQGLLNALPRLGPGKMELKPIPGEIDLADLPPGCAFAPRCSRNEEWCWKASPELAEVGPGHQAACFLAGRPT